VLIVAHRCPPAPACRSNEDVVSICNKLASRSCDEIAAELTKQAVAQGSTDDVTTLVLKLK
jgi:serine/threonine protein phosphatase PrpC